jgi:hypothetical protein
MQAVPVVVAVAVAVSSGAPASASRTNVRDLIPTHALATDLPVTRQHHYRMAGKVRMFLLWVGREDVGGAIINWRGGGHERAYELLIGSDPSKAPGQLNKWGYLVEEIRGADASVVGLISKDDEDRLSDVKEGLAARQTRRPFDTVRGGIGYTEAYARVGTLFAPSHLTYRDARAVLDLVLEDKTKPVKRLPRPGGVRSGFLTSLSELIDTTLARHDRGKSLKVEPIPYVHGDRLFELRLLETTSLPRFELDGRVYERVTRSRFETARVGNRVGTRFELVYGASGHLTGIPILVSYQPKWWLQVDLVLQQ